MPQQSVSDLLPLEERLPAMNDRSNRNRNATISIRISKAEKNFISQRASLAGKSITSFIVESALKSDSPNIQGVTPILNKLNQIQRILKRIEVEDKSLQAAYMKDIFDLQNKIYSSTYRLALKEV